MNRGIYLSAFLHCMIFFAVFHYGLRGIDFGYHWDEPVQIKLVKKFVDTGEFLPNWYEKPSLSYDILVLKLLLQQSMNASDSGKAPLKNKLSDMRFSWNSFLLDARPIYLFLTLLSSTWLFILILLWRKDPIEALLASTILLLSWEINYHGRWLAVDGLVMSFGTLSLLLMYTAIKSNLHSKFFLRMAAVTVGIACGAKYPGGIFILPLICASFLIDNRRELRYAYFLEPFILIAVFSLSFLITTPGAIIEPLKFLSDVQLQLNHYSQGHRAYTVDSSLLHGRLILEYFAFSAFSKYSSVALIVFGFSCIGLYNLVRNEPKIAIWFLIVPISYLLYFSHQNVMVVRNLLIIFPFLSILAGRGISVMIGYLRAPYLKAATYFGLGVALTLNTAWLHISADSIYNKASINVSNDIVSYIKRNPDVTFFVTNDTKKHIDIPLLNELTNVRGEIDDADKVIFRSSEGRRKENQWIVNRHNTYEIVSGSFEVNWDYYSSWNGDAKILAVKKIDAVRIGLAE